MARCTLKIAQINHLFAAIVHELSTHMLKEEQVLFPLAAHGTGSSGGHTGS
jgi:iron-sulfur cluster repair protein YtfE (RIC family)